jgi:FkbM family methyltransferase
MKEVLKRIYPFIPLKQQLFRAVKFFGTPSERVYRHLHFEGDFSVRLDSDHSFRIRHHGFELENTIFWQGLRSGWEATSIDVWMKLARRSTVIFDVGANTGIYSLIARCLNTEAKVYAIEPIRRVYEKLLINAQLNEFDIECFAFAASDRDGFAMIYDSPGDHTYSSTFHDEIFENEEFEQIEVPVMRLETFIRDHKTGDVDLIKLDIEGHEPAALLGLGSCLTRCRPTILIEILTDEVGQAVERTVQDCGYNYFYINEESGLVEPVRELTRRKYYNYLLAREDAIATLA